MIKTMKRELELEKKRRQEFGKDFCLSEINGRREKSFRNNKKESRHIGKVKISSLI